jgi:hypothetical protein
MKKLTARVAGEGKKPRELCIAVRDDTSIVLLKHTGEEIARGDLYSDLKEVEDVPEEKKNEMRDAVQELVDELNGAIERDERKWQPKEFYEEARRTLGANLIFARMNLAIAYAARANINLLRLGP